MHACTRPYAEEWQRFHRQRLVQLSQQHPGHLDAAFTGYLQCQPPQCAAMAAQYGGTAPSMDAAQLFDSKYQVVVDGNGAATRLAPTLCSGAASMLASPPVFQEWFHFRMAPWRHHIPIKCAGAGRGRAGRQVLGGGSWPAEPALPVAHRSHRSVPTSARCGLCCPPAGLTIQIWCNKWSGHGSMTTRPSGSQVLPPVLSTLRCERRTSNATCIDCLLSMVPCIKKISSRMGCCQDCSESEENSLRDVSN